MHAPPKKDHPIATPETLKEHDAFLFGVPTRYGNMPAQFKVGLPEPLARDDRADDCRLSGTRQDSFGQPAPSMVRQLAYSRVLLVLEAARSPRP